MLKRFLLLAFFVAGLATLRAQLAITETLSSASTNLGPVGVTQGPDFWELTNFGTNSMDLTGFRFNDSDATFGGDADTTTLNGVTIGPGESIILVQSGTTVVNTRDDFVNWWGAASLPTNLQVLFYAGNGQSADGDSIVLWDSTTTSDPDYIDRADFGEATRGRTFTYNPTNGVHGILSSNGSGGAFKAVTADDEGSPGRTTGAVPLAIVQQPSPTNQTIPAGVDMTFTVGAKGLPRARYQWRFQGNPIPGAIRSTLTVTNAQLADSGQYSVIVSNGLQTIISSNANLTVTATPFSPTFTTTPKDTGAYIGQTVQFNALANGSPTPSYQWQSNGVPLAGQTAPQLTLLNVQTNDAATYTVVAMNSAGTNTASAVLTVAPKPRLLITEVHSTGSSSSPGHQDWWELTSFDDRPINLQGYRYDDNSHSFAPNNAYTITNNVTIHPGESVIFVETLTASQFRTWWGTNLPAGLQIITYSGPQLSLSSAADEVNVWNGASIPGNELLERICGVNFAACPVGFTFVYDPENPPVAGILSVISTNTTAGAAANGIFLSAQGGDTGSPGYVVAPLRLASAVTNGSNLAVSWKSVVNRNYTVQYTTNLAGTNWITLSGITATDTNTAAVDFFSSPERFYRVGTGIPFVPEP